MSLIIKITNDGTGTPEVGHYDFVVSVNTGVIAKGRIKGFQRADGWLELVQEMLDVVLADDAVDIEKDHG